MVDPSIRDQVVAVVGLGYVGLPLAVEFGKQVSDDRLRPLAGQGRRVPARRRSDRRSERARSSRAATQLEVHDGSRGAGARPTSSSSRCRRRSTTRTSPTSRPLLGASESVGRHLKRGATSSSSRPSIPGATEEICIPVLEQHSGMKWKQDFFVGYSPERINPGDKEHTLTRITKVVSGDTPETLERVAQRLRQRSSPPASTARAASRSPRPPR